MKDLALDTFESPFSTWAIKHSKRLGIIPSLAFPSDVFQFLLVNLEEIDQ